MIRNKLTKERLIEFLKRRIHKFEEDDIRYFDNYYSEVTIKKIDFEKGIVIADFVCGEKDDWEERYFNRKYNLNMLLDNYVERIVIYAIKNIASIAKSDIRYAEICAKVTYALKLLLKKEIPALYENS